MRKPETIYFEREPFWVCAAAQFKGFEIWQNVGTHSERVARIGYQGVKGLEKAKAEIDRRIRRKP